MFEDTDTELEMKKGDFYLVFRLHIYVCRQKIVCHEVTCVGVGLCLCVWSG